MKKFLVIACVLVLVGAASATFTPIPQPTLAYTSSTTKLAFVGDGSTITSLSDGTLQVNFSVGMQQRQVPTSWATWGSPPDTESSTPAVLFGAGASTVTMTFSVPLSTFGFEAEPDLFTTDNMIATYLNGGDIIAQLVNGSAGAKLFAATSTTPITSVVFTDTAGGDFAIAQLRYSTTTTPEPGSLVLLGCGLAGLAGLRRKLQK